MVPRPLTVLTSLLLVGAGCLGGPGTTDALPASQTPPAPSETPEASASVATTVTTATTPDPTTDAPGTGADTYGTDCPYHLHANVASESQLERFDRRVAYATLSEPRQEEFRRAISGGIIELGNTRPEPWGEVELVKYEGERYAVAASLCRADDEKGTADRPIQTENS